MKFYTNAICLANTISAHSNISYRQLHKHDDHVEATPIAIDF